MPTLESGTILVLATSFADDMPTRPPRAGEGAKILERVVAGSHGTLTVSYRCDRDPHESLDAREFDGVVSVIADLESYPREFLDSVGKGRGGSLGLIARYGVGVDSVDVAAATDAGVLVSNTPGANSRPTAEWAVSTLLDIAGRRIPHHERSSRGLGKHGPSRLDVSGRTLGVIGTGAIGRTVVELLAGFDMTVIACDPYPGRQWAAEHGVVYVELEEICRTADFITLHAASADRIIGNAELSLMRPTTALVNCAREVLVDTRAAYEAVAGGRLWGYGLDESWGLQDLPIEGLNIAVSGHVGSDTDSGKAMMQYLSARSVEAYLAGRLPEFTLNPKVLESGGA